MRNLKSITLAGLFIFFITTPAFIKGTKPRHVDQPFTVVENSSNSLVKADMIYDSMQLESAGLSKTAFEYAIKGFEYLKSKSILTKTSLLSICDFSQSSRQKRFYIIDVEEMKLLVNTYVAHGRNSGGEYAQSFSNNPKSHKSSLGFYVTEKTYYGEHGLALRINGLERGFNDRADARNIVIHGSKYIGENFISSNPFAGRSFGCPAIPAEEANEVVNTIKDGTCLFIYHPTKKYIAQSKILNG